MSKSKAIIKNPIKVTKVECIINNAPESILIEYMQTGILAHFKKNVIKSFVDCEIKEPPSFISIIVIYATRCNARVETSDEIFENWTGEFLNLFSLNKRSLMD